MASLGFSIYIMSSAKRQFHLFLSELDAFYFFSCLIFLARNSSTMLSRSGESGHLCLVLDIKGKAFNLSLLSIMLVAGLLYMAFIMLRFVPSLPNLLSLS